MKISVSYSFQPIIEQCATEVSISMPFLEEAEFKPFFDNDARNRKWLAQKVKVSKVSGESHTGELIWYYHSAKLNTFYYYTATDGLVTYAIQCELVDVPTIGKAVCQTSLWRNKQYSSTTSIPSWVFYNQLMPKYGRILSDKSQSKDGREFWVRRIAEAFMQGYFVYVVDTRKGINILRVNDSKDYDQKWATRLWSTDQEYQKVRICISKTLI